jgi:hypothetical protein
MLGSPPVDGDERPSQTRQLARSQPAHQTRQPHRRAGVLRDGVDHQPLELRDRERLAGLRRSGLGQQDIGRRVEPRPPLPDGVEAGLVQVQPRVMDRAGGVTRRRHLLEHALDALGRGPVDPQVAELGPHAAVEQVADVRDRVR